MQCVLGSARKSATMHKLPLFSLLCSSENCTSPSICSLHTVEHHRLSGMATGRGKWSPATKLIYRPTLFAGRHWRWPAGQIFLQKLVRQQQRTKHGMAMHFKQMCAQPHPLSCLWLKGRRYSILGPPIEHYNAWWPKKPSCAFWFQMTCKPNKHIKPNLYHGDSRGKACMQNAMQPRHGS